MKLVPIGNIEARNGYYVTNDVTVWRRSGRAPSPDLTPIISRN